MAEPIACQHVRGQSMGFVFRTGAKLISAG
jgi:hypothetical protein